MMRFVWVTIPCAFLALAACGDGEPGPKPAPTDVSASDDADGRDPNAEQERPEERLVDWRALGGNGIEDSAKPDEDAKPDDEPPSDWSDIDDDPSFDAEDGSGDWCGTGMSGRRMPASFREIRLDDGRVIRLNADWRTNPESGWIEPSSIDGLWVREQRESLTGERERELMVRLAELVEALKAADDPNNTKSTDRGAVRSELREVRRALLLKEERWTQYGIDIGSVFHVSRRGETPEAFLKRVRGSSKDDDAKKDDAKKDDAKPKSASKSGPGAKLPIPEADQGASGTWSGPDANGFYRRRAAIPPGDTRPRFGDSTYLQYGVDRDGVFYTSRYDETAAQFVVRVEREAAAARAKREGGRQEGGK